MDDIPDIIVIVPYRDRKSQLNVFLNHMKWLLEGKKYEIFIVHQNDKRFFNRGAMKNLGFIYAREKYPYNYRNITLVFHDVDCLVSDKSMTDFQTIKGKVKHIFGFKQTFGGIFAIKGSDFESINGFPCIWNWGYEDNALRVRWLYKNDGKRYSDVIDYSEFFSFQDKRIVQMWHGDKKVFNRDQTWKSFKNSTSFIDGIRKITKIIKRPIEKADNVSMIHIDRFSVHLPYPLYAEKKALKTRQDFNWKPPPPPTKPTGSAITRKSFSNIFGRRGR